MRLFLLRGVTMSIFPSITPRDYVHYKTGEFVQLYGTGIHQNTKEDIVFLKTPKNKWLLTTKEEFDSQYIFDASSVNHLPRIQPFSNFKKYRHYKNQCIYYLLGEGKNIINNKDEIFFFNENKEFFCLSRNYFFEIIQFNGKEIYRFELIENKMVI
jgi:hypothetical protein